MGVSSGSLYYNMKTFNGTGIAKKALLIGLFLLSIVGESYADTHQFKYTPNDENNTSAVVIANTGTDTNGKQYWTRSQARFAENNVSWTSKNYIYVFVEASSTYLYNQSYIYGSSTYTNMSFYGGNGHDPDKINTFLVDGRYISMYRYYTQSGLTFPTFEYSVPGTIGVNRIYGFYPSDSFTPPNVTNQTTLYNFLGDFFNSNTHIVSFTPNEGDVLSATSSVNFTLNVYINPNDNVNNIAIQFINIDQNAILQVLATGDRTFLFNFNATTTGTYTFSSSTMLEKGNYRVQASVSKQVLNGLLHDPFSNINDQQSHQFIVGSSTFLGKITQDSFTETQALFNSFNATSTNELSKSCNLLNNFDTLYCLAFLFVPSSDQIQNSLNSFKDGVLIHAPWGYANRMFEIWNTASTSSLPSISVSLPTGQNTHEVMTADFGNMLVGGMSNINSISSPINHKSARDVLEPMVKLLIAIAVVLTILMDVMGSHKHNEHRT